MSVEIWAGAVAPEAYELVLSSAAVGGADLSSVSDADFVAKDPDGVEHTWAASHAWNGSTQLLTVTFTFHATSSEVQKQGTWRVYAKLTLPGGTVRSRPRKILVHERFKVPSDE